jgi:hypothetical protein
MFGLFGALWLVGAAVGVGGFFVVCGILLAVSLAFRRARTAPALGCQAIERQAGHLAVGPAGRVGSVVIQAV